MLAVLGLSEGARGPDVLDSRLFPGLDYVLHLHLLLDDHSLALAAILSTFLRESREWCVSNSPQSSVTVFEEQPVYLPTLQSNRDITTFRTHTSIYRYIYNMRNSPPTPARRPAFGGGRRVSSLLSETVPSGHPRSWRRDHPQLWRFTPSNTPRPACNTTEAGFKDFLLCQRHPVGCR